MTDRPDNVHCVKLDVAESEESWCGKWIATKFHFMSVDHALSEAANNGRLLICPECADKIGGTLSKGTWAGEDYNPDSKQFIERLKARIAVREEEMRENDPEAYANYLKGVKRMADLFEAERKKDEDGEGG